MPPSPLLWLTKLINYQLSNLGLILIQIYQGQLILTRGTVITVENQDISLENVYLKEIHLVKILLIIKTKIDEKLTMQMLMKVKVMKKLKSMKQLEINHPTLDNKDLLPAP